MLGNSRVASGLLNGTEILAESLAQLRSELMGNRIYVGDRQALEETDDGPDLILRAYAAVARETSQLWKEKKITDIQKQSLLFIARHSLGDFFLLPQGPEDAALFLNLILPPTSPPLPLSPFIRK